LYLYAGSLLTLATIEKAMNMSLNQDMGGDSCDDNSSTCSQDSSPSPSQIEGAWLDGFGRNGVLWSEYTLYRIVLDHFKVSDFDIIFQRIIICVILFIVYLCSFYLPYRPLCSITDASLHLFQPIILN
jgi:hypothetical protein